MYRQNKVKHKNHRSEKVLPRVDIPDKSSAEIPLEATLSNVLKLSDP